MDPGLFSLNLAAASLRLCKKFSLEQQEKELSKNRCNSREVISGAVDSTGSLLSLLSKKRSAEQKKRSAEQKKEVC